MTFPRIVLSSYGLMFVVLGSLFLAQPMAASALVQMDSTGSADVRAVYGGLECGIGVYLIGCAFQEATVRAGLYAMLAAFAGLAAGRAIGIQVDGPAGIFSYAMLLLEIGGALMAAAALSAARPAPDEDGDIEANSEGP
jgi:hypothetical protein